MTERHNFRRVILGLHHNVPRHGLRLAAEVAALLRIELCGLLVKEDELAGLAALPFAREFRPLEGGWHALDIDQLSHDLDIAADRAQKLLAGAASALGLSCQFEVMRCTMAEAITSVSRGGDIVIVPEPESPAERVTLQFQSMVTAALGSAAAVMVVPSRITRQRGPVVAVAAGPEDESIEVAAVIAALANEELIVVEAFERAGDAAASRATPPAAPVARRSERAGCHRAFGGAPSAAGTTGGHDPRRL